jgi:hypothetical protein
MIGPAVSPSFLKDLKLMDKNLGIFFNGNHFVITYRRPSGEPANIHRVKTEDGQFRYPDRRDLEFVKSGDLTSEGMESRLKKLASYSERIRERAKADAHDNIKAMTRDSRIQLANAAVRLTNQGKGNSSHRRVEKRRTGKTWDEIKSGATA